MVAKKEVSSTISINEISRGVVTLTIVGRSPLIFNSMSAKSKGALLLPEAVSRKSKADRAAAGLKHEPIPEFRRSVYRDISATGETRLMLPAPAFKGAFSTAALDLPNTKKSEIGRLVWVKGTYVPVWGVPQILMSVVRSADMNKTPDIRSRAILSEWCSQVTVEFVQPNLTQNAIINLAFAAGLICGVGDFRQEKGKGSYGQFGLVENAQDADFQRIRKAGGRKAQDAAMQDPECHDAETEELLSWYSAEVIKLNGKDSKAKAA